MDRRQVPLLGLLVLLVTAPGWLPRLDVWPESRPHAVATESRRIGWHDPAATDEIARDVFDRVNDERRARGLAPLSWHEGLTQLAREWSLRMIETGRHEHSPASFRTHPDFVGTGENIAMGYSGAVDVHVGWMRSDGHRQNVLGPDYEAVGIGVVCRRDGQMWATQIFGVSTPSGALATNLDAGVDPIVRQDPGPRCPGAGGVLP